MKNDHRSKFSSLSNWKEEALKIRASTGFDSTGFDPVEALIFSGFFYPVTCDNFVASLTKLVSSRPRDSSETFLLGKLVGHRAQSPVR